MTKLVFLMMLAGLASVANIDEFKFLAGLESWLEKIELYPGVDGLSGEKWVGGSSESEIASWRDLARQVHTLQAGLATRHSSKNARVFHTKSHGCLLGKLNLLTDRPDWTRRGIFSADQFEKDQKESYDVIVRFSNGLNDPDAYDSLPDLRGIAVKIFIPKGFVDPITGKRAYFVDLTMANTPWPINPTPEKFMEFAQVQYSKNKLKLIPWIKNNRGSARRLARGAIRNNVHSLAEERYWSQNAYLHSDGKQTIAIKSNLRPHHRPRTFSPLEDESLVGQQLEKLLDIFEGAVTDESLRHALREDLRKRSLRGIKFTLALQKEVSPEATPLEKLDDEWTEDESPSIDVAELVLHPQDFSPAPQEALCEDLGFTPRNYYPGQRPLEEMGRFRVFAYFISQHFRHAKLEVGPEDIKYSRFPPK